MVKIQINEKVTNLGNTLNSCYVVVEEIMINKDIICFSLLSYKSKADYEANAEWTIKVDEIKQIVVNNTGSYDFGNIIISNLCEKNNWNSNNLVIE